MAPVSSPTVAAARPLPDLGHRPALDGLRGLAVLVVLVDHANWPVPLSGGVGVTVFFALSGFLITLLLLAEERRIGRISLGRFWIRRLLRLYPALLAMSAAVALYLLIAQPADIAADTRMGLVGAVFYVTNWVSAWSDRLPGLMTHTWSLSIEEQFYVLWPPVLIGVRYLAGRWGWHRDRALLLVIGVLVVLSLVQRRVLVAEEASGVRLLWGTDTVAATLLAGCGLAVLLQQQRWRRVVTPVARWTGLPAVLLIGYYAVIVGRQPPLAREGAMQWTAVAATVLIAWLVTSPSWFARVLEHRSLVWLGMLSYSLYLWHYPIFHILRRETTWTGPSLAVLQLSVSMLVAVLSFFWIERPFMRLKDRWTAGAAAPPPAPEGADDPALTTVGA